MARIYTKSGDRGLTSLTGGERVLKSDQRVEAYGSVDELNASIGLLISLINLSEEVTAISEHLLDIQHRLFDIGAQLSTEAKPRFELPEIEAVAVAKLEKAIDHIQEQLPELKHFILPGGSVAAAQCHMSRCICRRAERNVVELAQSVSVPDRILIYLNRLSDFLFVLSRKILSDQRKPEIIWNSGS